MLTPRAAYIHVPFCAHRCGYCNFTVVAGRDDLAESYLAALECELSALQTSRPVETLFVGGGTPTHLPPVQLAHLLTLVRRWFDLSEGGEFSVEANPIDVTEECAEVLGRHGVTRVSLGAQSFSPRKLKLLERDHAAVTIVRAVEVARTIANSVSLDLIFAAPDETLTEWQADLAAALALPIDHVSTYGLTFERGTAFWTRRRKGALAEVDEGLQREMYCRSIDALSAAGFEHYEVSNFARAGHRCRHNEVYWAAEEYFAAGPGAARYIHGRREINHRSTTTWINRVLARQSPVAESEMLSPEDRAREALMLALRRIEGVDCPAFERRFGFSPPMLLGESLERLIEEGLLCCDMYEETVSRLALTRQGLLVSDAIWGEFLRV